MLSSSLRLAQMTLWKIFFFLLTNSPLSVIQEVLWEPDIISCRSVYVSGKYPTHHIHESLFCLLQWPEVFMEDLCYFWNLWFLHLMSHRCPNNPIPACLRFIFWFRSLENISFNLITSLHFQYWEYILKHNSSVVLFPSMRDVAFKNSHIAFNHSV